MLKAGLKWRLTGSANDPPVQGNRSVSQAGVLKTQPAEWIVPHQPARSKGLGWASPPLFLIFGFGRDPPQEELLCQVGECALAGVDKSSREHPARAAIRRRVVGHRDGGCAQIATDGRVVRLPPSVVAPTDECERDRVESARSLRARALVEVARVLVQKRWQDGASENDVGKAAGIAGAIALSVTLRTLAVVRDVSCLVDGGNQTYPDESNGIEGDLGGELELQLRRERRGALIISDVEIGDDAENSLVLLCLDLLGGDLLGGSSRRIHSYCGKRLCDIELGARQDCVLAGLEDDGGGDPVCKSRSTDGDGVGCSPVDICVIKKSPVLSHHRERD